MARDAPARTPLHLQKQGPHPAVICAALAVAAAAFEPENGSARSDLGIALHKAGRVEDAGRAFVEAARLAPADLEVQRNAAIWAASEGRWALAAECLARADRLRPGDTEIARRLAEARARIGGRP